MISVAFFPDIFTSFKTVRLVSTFAYYLLYVVFVIYIDHSNFINW